MAQYWDSKGNLHIEGAKPIPLAEQLARKAQAAITNIGNWLNESNPNSEAYKQKANTALALLTMPIGAGAKVTQTIAQPLKPYVGRQIAKTTAEGIGAGATGGAVEGFGNGLIEGENPLLSGTKGLLYGAVGGGLFGLGAGKIGQYIDFKNLYKNGTPEAFNKYFDDYIEGLNNYTKPMADYRAAQRGVRPQEGNILNNFIGENAQNADRVALNKANELFSQGLDNESIRQQTGWFKGVDGKWRYEIPDGKFKENINWNKLNDSQSYVSLKNLYDNDLLYQAYPDIAELPIVRMPLDWQTMGGAYRYKDSSKVNGIMLNDRLFKNTPYRVWKDKIDDIYKTPEGAAWKKADEDWWNNRITNEEYEKIYDDFFKTDTGKLFEYLRDHEPGYNTDFIDSINNDGKKTLIHEIQHLIQEKENFARGGSADHPNYGNLAGEAEARLAEKRYGLSNIERNNINPLEQFDISPEKQIIEFDDNNLYQKLSNDDFDYDKVINETKERMKPKPIDPTLKKEGEIVIMKGSEPFEEGEINKIITDTTFPMSDDEIAKGVAVRYQGDHSFVTYYDKDGKHTMGKFKITEEKYD